MLKDNKLPKSDVSERLKAVREELEKIARDHLPNIEPNLEKARRELEAPAKPQPPDPKQQGELSQARAEQEKVQQALDELLRYMGEQSTLQQVRGELRRSSRSSPWTCTSGRAEFPRSAPKAWLSRPPRDRGSRTLRR